MRYTKGVAAFAPAAETAASRLQQPRAAGCPSAWRLFRKARSAPLRQRVCDRGSPDRRFHAGLRSRRLSGGDRQVVLPELEEVVGRGDQSPFGPAGPQASSLEAVDPSVVFRLREHRLDDRLSLPVELFAFVCG